MNEAVKDEEGVEATEAVLEEPVPSLKALPDDPRPLPSAEEVMAQRSGKVALPPQGQRGAAAARPPASLPVSALAGPAQHAAAAPSTGPSILLDTTAGSFR